MKNTRIVTSLVCDHCKTEKSDNGQIQYGGHPHSGWYHLNKINGSTMLSELKKKKEWDFCSKKCLITYLENGD